MADAIFTVIMSVLDHPAAIHAILFSVLLLSGTGIGLLSEEIVLLLGGYLAYLGFIGLPAATAVLTLGILGADIVGYAAGLWFGEWIENRIAARWGFARRMTEKVKTMFERHGDKMVMLSRPFYAVRVAVPMFAGHARMPFKKFFWYDALVSIPWTAAVVSASFFLSATLDVFDEARRIKHYFFIGAVLAVSVYAALRWIKGIAARV
ncbi:MAG: DedA family protein [Patescibacteria group bacterium]